MSNLPYIVERKYYTPIIVPQPEPTPTQESPNQPDNIRQKQQQQKLPQVPPPKPAAAPKQKQQTEVKEPNDAWKRKRVVLPAGWMRVWTERTGEKSEQKPSNVGGSDYKTTSSSEGSQKKAIFQGLPMDRVKKISSKTLVNSALAVLLVGVLALYVTNHFSL